MKVCSRCKIEQPYEQFRSVKPGKGCKMNLHSWCRTCVREARRNDYIKNKKKYAAWNKAYWKNNPEARRAYDLNRYTLKKNAEGCITKEVVKTVFETYGAICLKCGSADRLEIDHVIPLTKGGTNTFENLQVLCKVCNVRKGNRSQADYRKGEGRTTQ